MGVTEAGSLTSRKERHPRSLGCRRAVGLSGRCILTYSFDRRKFLRAFSALGLESALQSLAPAYAQGWNDAGLTRVRPGPKEVNLVIREQWIPIAEGRGKAVTVNGTVPAPILRFHEGDDLTIHVKNEMARRRKRRKRGRRRRRRRNRAARRRKRRASARVAVRALLQPLLLPPPPPPRLRWRA